MQALEQIEHLLEQAVTAYVDMKHVQHLRENLTYVPHRERHQKQYEEEVLRKLIAIEEGLMSLRAHLTEEIEDELGEYGWMEL